MPVNNQKKIVVLGTGGTIAGRSADPADNIGYQAGEVPVGQLVAGLQADRPVDTHGDVFDIVSEQVGQLDSKDMSVAIWQQLAARVQALLADASVQGIVITHGTDTIEETAYFLHALLAPAKPVVFTCAMRPASSRSPDGPQNLMNALTVAGASGASGVTVVCAGRIHSAMDVQKVHTYRLDAFDSGDAGDVGQVEEGQINLARNWPLAPVKYDSLAINKVVNRQQWPRVEIVLNHAGASGAIVRALLRPLFQDAPVLGLVAAGTGNGSLHQDLQAALVEAMEQGVDVVRATRCARGRVISTPDAVIPDSAGLSPVKARIAMMLRLIAGPPRAAH